MKATRATELVGYEVPDENYPVEEGRTRTVWEVQYVPITAKPLPLRKKYRS